jgi:hypothetical protein
MKRAVAFLVSAGMFIPTVASAACVQGDLAGTWQLYKNDSAWTRCRIVIDVSGIIGDAQCRQVFSDTKLALTEGSVALTVPPDCTFTAQFKIKGHAHKAQHATLSLDKNTAAGVGFYAANYPLTFSMIRIRN